MGFSLVWEELASFSLTNTMKLLQIFSVLAKGLGNGVPIGACLAKGVASKMLTPGTHGSTFGGNPLVTAAALGVLDVFQNTNVLDNVNEMSDYFKSEFDKKFSNNKLIKELRIKGLMIGIGLDSDKIDCTQAGQKSLER